MNEVVEMLINEKFDDVELSLNYKVKDCEVFEYYINGDKWLRCIVIDNRVIIMKKDNFYGEVVKNVCNNDDELKEVIDSLYD